MESNYCCVYIAITGERHVDGIGLDLSYSSSSSEKRTPRVTVLVNVASIHDQRGDKYLDRAAVFSCYSE